MAVAKSRFPTDCEVLVIGAGIVGVYVAFRLQQAGCSVQIVEAGPVLAGSSAAGEGNLLLSDKLPGPELDLALWSIKLWHEQAEQLGSAIEFETKGGLVVARSDEQLESLHQVTEAQIAHGISASPVDANELRELEPLLTNDASGGMFYPGDCQIQPMLATVEMLRQGQIPVHTSHKVIGITASRSGLKVSFGQRSLNCDWAVNAAGAWAGEVAETAGCTLNIQPRRGRILVTEPLPPLILHKVYEADYVASTQSDAAKVQFSSVVEATRSGPVLIGSSREFVGFNTQVDLATVASLAKRAASLFPGLSSARIIRTYAGFRPASPDHLPVIGSDPEMPRLIHATGHEGAGIGLAPGTAALVENHILGTQVPIDPAAFAPARFTKQASA